MTTAWAAATIAGSAVTAAMAAITYGVMHPASRMLAPVISRGPEHGPPHVALTFDDGPHPESTPHILDALAERGVKAAFAVIGVNAERWPAVVRRVHEEGHLLVNHSYNHSYVGVWRGIGYWQDQLGRTNAIIEGISGERPVYFRPPVGLKTPLIAVAARRAGLRIVTWSRRALDGVPTTAARITARLAERVVGHDIVAMHDGLDPHSRRNLKPTIEALGPLLDRWRARGLTMTRLDALLSPAV